MEHGHELKAGWRKVWQWGRSSPSPSLPPCCIYLHILFFLALSEKPPQDAAEDNPPLSCLLLPLPSCFFLNSFFIILIMVLLLLLLLLLLVICCPQSSALLHRPCLSLANLKSSGQKVRPWWLQRKVSNFDLPFSLRNSMLISLSDPKLFSVPVSSV